MEGGVALLGISFHARERARERGVGSDILENTSDIIENGFVIPPKHLSRWTVAAGASRPPAIHIWYRNWIYVIDVRTKEIITMYVGKDKASKYANSVIEKKKLYLRDIIDDTLEMKMWAA
jgi:hypothetical protein